MGEYKLGFTAKDNDLAFKLYEALAKENVSLADMDTGYSEINYAGIHCDDKNARTCIKGEKDFVVSPEEVFEYGLNNYEKYQKLLEGILGEPLPWVLDDLDTSTTFDADIRQKVQDAINVLKDILQKNGIKEGTEEYKEKLAVGLFWLAAFPSRETLNEKIVDSKRIEKRKTILEHVKKDLENNGLSNFWGYLNTNGGFRIEGDFSGELTALDALKHRNGECTELSNILYGIFRMAGLTPLFVVPESGFKFVEELKTTNDFAKYFMGQLDNLSKGSSHVYIGDNFKGQLRFFDPSLFDSSATYKSYYSQSLSQFLSGYITNHGVAWSKKGEFDKAIADFSEAIKIYPKSHAAYSNRGIDWLEKGEFDKAIADHSEAIKINPKHESIYFNRGIVWSIKGEFDKAIADFSEAILINPKNDVVYYNRGVVWGIKGEFDKAIADYSEAIKINPKDEKYYVNRGLAWRRKGEINNAIADFLNVFKLSNMKFDEISELLTNILTKYWQKDADRTVVMNTFAKDTEGLDMPKVESYFVLSYALWLAGKKDEAVEKFGTIEGAIIFNDRPSPSTKEFLSKMIAPIPPAMKKDPKVQKMLRSLEVKIKK